ncbi:MAG: hypothetical protein ACREYE_01965, partial [Gammaproteobacteria bacterium]
VSPAATSCPHPPVKPNYTGLLRERFRYSSELRANRLPAGQIAVLSRIVLARILRLDRRTGISAKEDLTAPPQTCRKDTGYPMVGSELYTLVCLLP